MGAAHCRQILYHLGHHRSQEGIHKELSKHNTKRNQFNENMSKDMKGHFTNRMYRWQIRTWKDGQYTFSGKVQIKNRSDREPYSIYCNNLDWKRIWEVRFITEPLFCVSETNPILQINHTSSKKKKNSLEKPQYEATTQLSKRLKQQIVTLVSMQRN